MKRPVRIGRLSGREVLTYEQLDDNGPGFLNPSNAFVPFYTTKPVGSGTGLGLSTSYGIIQEHGGDISCGNREDGGAVFTVRLPIAAESVQAAAANLVG